MTLTVKRPIPGIVSAPGEEPIFRPGDRIRVMGRSPIGHYRVPIYLRGKSGTIEAMIRFLMLPQRPAHTENFSEEQLAALITRDAMIGVVRANTP